MKHIAVLDTEELILWQNQIDARLEGIDSYQDAAMKDLEWTLFQEKLTFFEVLLKIQPGSTIQSSRFIPTYEIRTPGIPADLDGAAHVRQILLAQYKLIMSELEVRYCQKQHKEMGLAVWIRKNCQ